MPVPNLLRVFMKGQSLALCSFFALVGEVGPHADVDIDGGHILFKKGAILCMVIIIES